MEGILALFIPILTILSLFAYVIIRFYLSSKERKYLIERGLDAETIKALYTKPTNPDNKYKYLRYGLFAIGIGAGIALGDILNDVFNRPSLQFFTILVFIGIVFLVSYHLESKEKSSAK